MQILDFSCTRGRVRNRKRVRIKYKKGTPGNCIDGKHDFPLSRYKIWIPSLTSTTGSTDRAGTEHRVAKA